LRKIIIGIILSLFLVGCSASETVETQNGDEILDFPDAEGSVIEPQNIDDIMVPDDVNLIEEDMMLDEEDFIGEMTDAGYIDVTPEEAKMLIDDVPELVVIDVSPNYDAGHLPGAVNYYVGDGSLDEAIPTLDPEGVYLVYCHVDSAAILGAEKLVDAGFVEVYRLKDNYAAWVDAGYEVEV
jgi:rhodanese-related sulfurtransferase